MPNIRLPDGSSKSFPGPVTVAEIASSIGPGLARVAVEMRLNLAHDGTESGDGVLRWRSYKTEKVEA